MSFSTEFIIGTILTCLGLFLAIYYGRGQREAQNLRDKLLNDENKPEASFNLQLKQTGRNEFKFFLTNVGQVEANEVNLKLRIYEPNQNPLITEEVRKKLPIAKLLPDSYITLMASIYIEGPKSFEGIITWKNSEGQSKKMNLKTVLEYDN